MKRAKEESHIGIDSNKSKLLKPSTQETIQIKTRIDKKNVNAQNEDKIKMSIQKNETNQKEENGKEHREGTDASSSISTSLVLRKEENEAEGLGIRCLHEVCYPEGRVPVPLKPVTKKPAKEYPFTLDPFQSEAIKCLESDESVLVAAHTSAGKTVVAEYAIAMSLRDHQRVIYTSPIKALSNQKYRELAEEFSDVGLMTGDITISPNASCLVMTTEILRSMLYRGSEVTKEIKWLIFDEVHYMRDKERGVVWEESIIMSPADCRFVFLSATLPNASEFAYWVAKVHNQPCHIVYTDYRPTPLQHYIFPSNNDGLFLIVDEKGNFREDTFQKAVNSLTSGSENDSTQDEKNKSSKKKSNATPDSPSDIFKIVKMIMQRQYDPVIVFSFSKNDCEQLALQMAKMDLLDKDEKDLLVGVYTNAIDSLSQEDKNLPQVSSMLSLAKRGIGIHHAGLLPILKEIIEILFQEGLLKCLFATETFSIGLNMPAKTVVFTHVRKFDGDKYRYLSGGEYIQMSGRAGRRGIDTRGICILMLDARLEPAVAKSMLKGSADPLESAFYLSYNMILNQMRSEESNIENLIKNSFCQFQADKSVPQLKEKVKKMESEKDEIVIEEEDKIIEFEYHRKQYMSLKKSFRNLINCPIYALPFLSPGRIIKILQKCPKVSNPKLSNFQKLANLENFDEFEPLQQLDELKTKNNLNETNVSVKDEIGGEDKNKIKDVRNKNIGADKLKINKKDETDKTRGAENDKTSGNKNFRKLKLPRENFAWAVVVNFKKISEKKSLVVEEEDKEEDANKTKKQLQFQVDVLTKCVEDEEAMSLNKNLNNKVYRPCREDEEGEAMVIGIPLSQLLHISSIRIYISKDLKQKTSKENCMKSLKEVMNRFPNGIPMLDLEEDMKIEDEDYRKIIRRIETVENLIERNPLVHSPSILSRLNSLKKKEDMENEIKLMKKEVKTQAAMVKKEELKARRKVLKRLGYVSEDNVVELKGRVACEISTANELVLTEMLFGGLFNEPSAEVCAALISCFVWQEKANASVSLKEEFKQPYARLREVARKVAKMEVDCKLPVNVEDFVNSFRPDIMEAVYAWCKGAKFSTVLKLVDTYEGSIIRAMRRLDEVLRQLVTACKSIGESELSFKFEDAMHKLQKDIVFAASLYL